MYTYNRAHRKTEESILRRGILLSTQAIPIPSIPTLPTTQSQTISTATTQLMPSSQSQSQIVPPSQSQLIASSLSIASQSITPSSSSQAHNIPSSTSLVSSSSSSHVISNVNQFHPGQGEPVVSDDMRMMSIANGKRSFACQVCKSIAVDLQWKFCNICGSKLNVPDELRKSTRMSNGDGDDSISTMSGILSLNDLIPLNSSVDNTKKSITLSAYSGEINQKSIQKSGQKSGSKSSLKPRPQESRQIMKSSSDFSIGKRNAKPQMDETLDSETIALSNQAKSMISNSLAQLAQEASRDEIIHHEAEWLEIRNAEMLESCYEELTVVDTTNYGLATSSLASGSQTLSPHYHRSVASRVESIKTAIASQPQRTNALTSGYLDEIQSVETYYRAYVAREYELMNLKSSSTAEVVTNPVAPEDMDSIGMLWTNTSLFAHNADIKLHATKGTVNESDPPAQSDIIFQENQQQDADKDLEDSTEQNESAILRSLQAKKGSLGLVSDSTENSTVFVDPAGGVSMLWTNVLLANKEVQPDANEDDNDDGDDEDEEEKQEEAPRELTEDEKREQLMKELMGHVVAFASTKGRSSPHQINSRYSSPTNGLENEDTTDFEADEIPKYPSYSIISRIFLTAVRDLKAVTKECDLKFKDDRLFRKEGLEELATVINKLQKVIGTAEAKDVEARETFEKFRVRSKNQRSAAAMAVSDTMQRSAEAAAVFSEQFAVAKAQFDLKSAKDVGFVSATGRHIVSDAKMDSIVREADESLAKFGAEIQKLQTEETDITIRLRSEEATSIMSVRQWRPRYAAWLQDTKKLLAKYIFVRRAVAARMIQKAARRKLLMYFRKGFTFRRNRRGVIILSSIRIKR